MKIETFLMRTKSLKICKTLLKLKNFFSRVKNDYNIQNTEAKMKIETFLMRTKSLKICKTLLKLKNFFSRVKNDYNIQNTNYVYIIYIIYFCILYTTIIKYKNTTDNATGKN